MQGHDPRIYLQHQIYWEESKKPRQLSARPSVSNIGATSVWASNQHTIPYNISTFNKYRLHVTRLNSQVNRHKTNGQTARVVSCGFDTHFLRSSYCFCISYMSSQSFGSSAHIIVVADISGWKWVCDLTWVLSKKVSYSCCLSMCTECFTDGVVFILSIHVHKIFHGRIQTVPTNNFVDTDTNNVCKI